MKKIKRMCGFTLAEILIALTVVGIIAALTVPALMASVDEKVYTAQKKAFAARMTNAITQFNDLSGYGTSDDNYAEAFIIQLSKVYKMNSICGSQNLKPCDIPATVVAVNGTHDVDLLDAAGQGILLKNLNKKATYVHPERPLSGNYRTPDAKPAAFTTTNGESVLVYYNPKCISFDTQNWQHTQEVMCVNMIFDLNGENEPNQVGKDIGFLTVFSNTDPRVGAPIPDTKDYNFGSTYNYDDAVTNCSKNQATRLPDIDELGSIFTNNFLLGEEDVDYKAGIYWSGSAISTGSGGLAWRQNFNNGFRYQDYRTYGHYVRCVRR